MAGYWEEVLADSPRVLWKLDEAGGGPADSSGLSHPGTAAGTLTYRGTGPDATGIPYALGFGGGTITLADHADIDLGNGPFTIELWLKRTAAGVSYVPLAKNDASTAPGYGLYWTGDLFRLTDGAGLTNVRQTTADTDLGWHHWVFTRAAAANGIVWRDGVNVATVSNAVTFTDNASSLVLGEAAFSGLVAGLAVYKSELSGARVAAHYAARGSAGAPVTPGWTLGLGFP